MSDVNHGVRVLPALRRVDRQRAATPLERGGWFLLLLLLVLTLGAWTLTIEQARTMDMPMGIVVSSASDPDRTSEDAGGMAGMPGMQMPKSRSSQMETMTTTGMSGMTRNWEGLSVFLVPWSVMMAAMMFPAAAPMILFFHRVATQRKGERSAFVATWIFAAGYLLTWVGIGVATWVLIRLISDLAARISDSSREVWAPLSLGTVLVVAGLYQFTPLKRVCLRHCQSPVGFVMSHWREGRDGALRMGIRHGMYCLGCCWMLFAVLVATGVMSLLWMLVLTLVVFSEKVLRSGTRVGQLGGVAFVILGVLIASGLTDLPWRA